MCSWYIDKGPENDVVLSSRIRLARNLKNYPFPNRMSAEQAQKISDQLINVLNRDVNLGKEYTQMVISKISDIDKLTLLEKHLISADLIRNNQPSAAMISKDEKVSVMINEEDHIRIQSILPGMQLEKAYELSDNIDNVIEDKVEYAYSENIGYLTSCPTNAGTGLRASVMVHLPALSMIGYINGLLSTIGKLGIAVRGIYGEGSQVVGNMYQISNQITLGQSEDDIISSINSIISQIIEQERMARNKILKENSIQLEDKIYRAYGIFTNARLLSSVECMSLLSDIKLGIDLGIIGTVSPEAINELMIITQPAFVQKITGRALDEKERDLKRAEIVRKKLTKKES